MIHISSAYIQHLLTSSLTYFFLENLMCTLWSEINFLYFLQLSQAAFCLFVIPHYFDVYTACRYWFDRCMYFKCLFYVYLLYGCINISYIVACRSMLYENIYYQCLFMIHYNIRQVGFLYFHMFAFPLKHCPTQLQSFCKKIHYIYPRRSNHNN